MLRPYQSILCFALVLLLGVASGCTSAPAAFSPAQPSPDQPFYTFTDGAGNQVTLQKRPEKVAVLFSSYADVWASAGGRVDVTVGESVKRGFAEESAALVDEAAGHSSIDLETLIAEQPDLIIGTADYECQVDACAFASKQGIPSALFRVETFADYLEMLRICCDITGNEERYFANGTQIQEQIEQMLSQIRALPEKNASILFVRAGSSAKSTKAKTAADHFVCKMLNELKTRNIADRAPVLLDGLSLETIVAADPDYVFISPMGDEQAATDYMNDVLSQSGWRELDSVKNERCVYLPKALFHYKPNARWAEAYAYLIGVLYPEIKIEA